MKSGHRFRRQRPGSRSPEVNSVAIDITVTGLQVVEPPAIGSFDGNRPYDVSLAYTRALQHLEDELFSPVTASSLFQIDLLSTCYID